MNYFGGARPSARAKLDARADVRTHHEVQARLMAHVNGNVKLQPSVDLAIYQPPIYDQGPTGSCTAHSGSGSVATAFSAAGMPLGFIPSPDLLYKITRALERAHATPAGHALPGLTDSGAELADVVAVLSRYGMKSMSAPTPDGRQSDVTLDGVNLEPDLTALEMAGDHTIAGAYAIDTKASDASDVIAAALMSGIPVLVAFYVDSKFEQMGPNDVAGVPDESDPNGGGHAVYLSGYRTNAAGAREFRLTNSWGSAWCDVGRCWVSEAFINAMWEAWPMAVARKGA